MLTCVVSFRLDYLNTLACLQKTINVPYACKRKYTPDMVQSIGFQDNGKICTSHGIKTLLGHWSFHLCLHTDLYTKFVRKVGERTYAVETFQIRKQILIKRLNTQIIRTRFADEMSTSCCSTPNKSFESSSWLMEI